MGRRWLDGIVEHHSLEMTMNETQTTFQTGDAVFMQTPEGCEETYIARIEKMWQEGEDPETRGRSCMPDALPMVLSGTYRSKSTYAMPDVVP
jgi:hypothetical protein